MGKLINILTMILRTIQLILVLILSTLTWLVQFNKADFKYRWSFESCNFNNINPIGDESVINTLLKIWGIKKA